MKTFIKPQQLIHKTDEWINRHNVWFDIVVSFLLLVLTFPMFEPDFGVGLDSSYVWGFNYLFDHDYNTLINLIYPYGPFLWLKSPTIEGFHFELALLFFAIVKFFFIWLTIQLSRRSNCSFIVATLALIPACVFGNIDVFIVLDIALLTLLYIERQQITFFLLATLLSIFSLFIKTSIGVQSCAVLFVGWIISIVLHRNIKQSILSASSVFVVLAVVGLAVCHSFQTLLASYSGILHLVSGYSGSLVLMPDHKSWALILFAMSTFAMPPLLSDKRSRTYYLLLLIPLFASWKHGIVREDFYHFKQLIAFATCFFATVPLSVSKRRWTASGCGILALSMLFVNISSLRYSQEMRLTTVQPANFAKLLFKHNQIRTDAVRLSQEALESRQLDSSILKQVGDKTLDCYPWEQIFVAANGFNWQPHTTFELGAGNSEWLNHKSAQNFKCDSHSVAYVLLHKTDFSSDKSLQSLDGRYLLNDEPEVFDSIFTNYHISDTGWYGLLLQQGRNCYTPDCGIISSVKTTWNEWVPIPQHTNSCIRAEIRAKDNIFGHLRSLLYKPDIYYVDYMMPDSSICTHRFSPSTAKGGLWVGPLLTSYADISNFLNGINSSTKPIAIRLRPKHNSGHSDSLSISFRKTIALQQEH